MYEMVLQSAVLESIASRVLFGHSSISNLSLSIWDLWKSIWSGCVERFSFWASMFLFSAYRFVIELLSLPLNCWYAEGALLMFV